MIKMLSQSGAKYTLTFGGQQMSCIGQLELKKLIGEHYDDIISEFNAQDFNVVKDDFDEATAIAIDEDPTTGMEEDELVYSVEDIEEDNITDEEE